MLFVNATQEIMVPRIREDDPLKKLTTVYYLLSISYFPLPTVYFLLFTSHFLMTMDLLPKSFF